MNADPAPFGPNADSQINDTSNLQHQPSEAAPEPPVVSSFTEPGPSLTEKPKNRMARMVFGFIFVAILTGLLITMVYMKKQAPKSSDTPTISSTGIGAAKVTMNPYRVYRALPAYAQQKSVASYIYANESSILKQVEGPATLKLLTPVGSNAFLFIDDASPSSLKYYLFSQSGLSELKNLPQSMTKSVNARSSAPRPLVSFGEDSVIFPYCKDGNAIQQGESRYQCDVRVVNVANGKEQVLRIPETLGDYNAQLLTFSSDLKSAYYLGVSKDAAAAYSELATKATGAAGGLVSENDPKAQALFGLNIKRSVLQLDLSSAKIISTKTFDTPLTYYQQFWLSPNGKHLLFSNGGEAGSLSYVDVSTGVASKIAMPHSEDSTEPWSGETTTLDPLFSPSGDYMMYVSYHKQANKFIESTGVVDLKSKSTKDFIVAPTSSGDTSGAKGFFDNARWLSDTLFELSAGSDNYQLDASSFTAKKIDSSHGLIVGIADGFR